MNKKDKSTKLTKAHLHQLKIALQNNRREVSELGHNFERLSKEDREKLFGDGVWWAWVYELPVVQHLALYFSVLGLIGQVRAVLDGAEDKAQALLDFGNRYEPDDDTVDALLGPAANTERKAILVSLFMALLRQIECLEKYGCYLSDLVEKVRKGGEEGDEAFLRALRIDRTIVSCPTFGERLTRAVLDNDAVFLGSVAKGIKTKWKKASPHKKEEHKDLRIMLQATYEADQLQRLTVTEADELFIKELAVYSDDGQDPLRGLQKFILRFKNSK